MPDSIFQFLFLIDEIFWGYIAFILIMIFGFYLTARTGFFQIRALPNICKTFFHFLKHRGVEKRGIHPLQAFFASAGGMIGIGNLVGIVTAVQLGGPGALMWVWFAGMIGAIVKYSEIYLGFKFRVENKEGGYDGGPMYFLPKAFGTTAISFIVAALLCVYGIEIYQFSVITESISYNWGFNRLAVIVIFLAFVLYASLGGVKRVGQISSWIMPIFLVIYILMGSWVIFNEIEALPAILLSVFKSAFTGHAAVGGFAGSTVVLAIQHGIGRAAYSSDIGIGYDAIIHSESSAVHPERQARLAILGVGIDNLICTFSILVVLVSGVWKGPEVLEGSLLLQSSLGKYFPYMKYFMPFFFIAVGYTTIAAYFVMGIKCARYLAPKWGQRIYILYGMTSFLFFSYVPQIQALLVMSISGSLLLMINLFGIFRLRREIFFVKEKFTDNQPVEKAVSSVIEN